MSNHPKKVTVFAPDHVWSLIERYGQAMYDCGYGDGLYEKLTPTADDDLSVQEVKSTLRFLLGFHDTEEVPISWQYLK